MTTPTRAAVEALPVHRWTPDGMKLGGKHWIDRDAVLALFPQAEANSPESPDSSEHPAVKDADAIAHKIVQDVIEDWGNNELFIDAGHGPGDDLRKAIAAALRASEGQGHIADASKMVSPSAPGGEMDKEPSGQ